MAPSDQAWKSVELAVAVSSTPPRRRAGKGRAMFNLGIIQFLGIAALLLLVGGGFGLLREQ